MMLWWQQGHLQALLVMRSRDVNPAGCITILLYATHVAVLQTHMRVGVKGRCCKTTAEALL